MRKVTVDGADSWLSRRTVWVYSTRSALFAIVSVSFVIGLVAFGLSTSPTTGYTVGFLTFAVVIVLWWRSLLRALKRHNTAVTALGEGDHAGARSAFAEVLHFATTTGYAAPALHNLGYVALLEGDFSSAVALLSAANAVLGQRVDQGFKPYIALFRSRLAMCLIHTKRLDEADALIETVSCDSPDALAMCALARAYLDYSRGRYESVVSRLDQSRAVILRSLVGFNAATALALEALSLRQLDGIYRGASRQCAQLPFGNAMRERVDRLVPGAATVLTSEDPSPAAR